MNEDVFYAVAAVIGGIVVGAAAGGLTRNVVRKGLRRESADSIASAAAGFVFWIAVAVGVAVAVAIIAPDSLDPLPGRILAYLPNVLVAGLIVIVGRATATVASAVLGTGLAQATGRTRREIAVVLRMSIMLVVVVLALSQLGVNTQILMILAASILFSLGTAMALLIGLGGRDVAADVAAGRYLRRILTVGSYVESSVQSGRIVALHAATIEFKAEHAGTVHVPNSTLIAGLIHLRPDPEQARVPSDAEPHAPTDLSQGPSSA